MKLLIHKSLSEQVPIEMIYLSDKQQFTQRKIVVKQVDDDYIKAFCLLRGQTRIFKRDNILSIMPIRREIKRTS
ncbi:hypothetical protein [Bacillus tuaregi]|uniref:hypothetical protein n=1 Tax=Bacillus tuaregi TaxID=1816695 RepID=UPI0008F7FC06|nr:hypothetical protein [Bacillus tuaregi]